MGKDKRALPIDETLCEIKEHIRAHIEEYKELVRQPTHVCRKCGRVANSPDRLCKPEPL